jgi:hypothetical protein
MVIPVVNYQRQTTRVEDDCVSKNFPKTLKFCKNSCDSIFDTLVYATSNDNTLLIPTCLSQLKDIDLCKGTVIPRLSTICDYGEGSNSSNTCPTIEQGITR